MHTHELRCIHCGAAVVKRMGMHQPTGTSTAIHTACTVPMLVQYHMPKKEAHVFLFDGFAQQRELLVLVCLQRALRWWPLPARGCPGIRYDKEQ